MICGSGAAKSRLAEVAGAEPSGQMRDEKLHGIVARSTFLRSKCTRHTRPSTFGSCDVKKVIAVAEQEASSECSNRNTMRVKDGVFGPAAACSERCFINGFEASFQNCGPANPKHCDG